MKKLIVQFGLFSSPLLICLVLFIVIPWRIGVSQPLEMVAQHQLDDDNVIYEIQVEDYFEYKLYNATLRQPDILLIGSSRSANFEADFFNTDTVTFYNAFVPAINMAALTEFWQRLDPQSYPDVLLIQTDLLDFHPNYEEPNLEITDIGWTQSEFVYHRTVDFWGYVARGYITLDTIGSAFSEQSVTDDYIGLNVERHRVGIDAYGARFYGAVEERPANPNLQLRLTLPTDNQVSEHILAQFEELLSTAQQHNIQVIGFEPPYSATAYEAITGEDYPYVQTASAQLALLFAEYEAIYLDLSDATLTGLSDDYMGDFWHLDQAGTAQFFDALVNMLPQQLGRYVDDAPETDT